MSFKIMVKIEDNEVKTLLAGMLSRAENAQPVMHIFGEIVKASIMRNFEKGGRPTQWKPSLRALKTGGKTLVNKGVSGGLMGSIHYRAYTSKVEISANKVYAAVHQFGIGARSIIGTRRRMPAIPARPYLLVQDEDWMEMKEATSRYLTEGSK